MGEQRDRKNKRIAWITSVGIHGLLLLAFMLMMAWRAPNPPLPEYGIELNFGMDDQGGGEVQPETSPGAPEEANDQAEEEQTEAVQPEEQVKEEPIPEKTEEPIVSKLESPVVVKEEPVKDIVKVEKGVVSKPKETPTNEEVKKDTQLVDQKGAGAKKGDPTTSEGDDGKKGNKGDPEGKLLNTSTTYSGQQGGGGGDDGFGLSMAGWEWANPLNVPSLDDNHNGKIVFEITCDANGDITFIELKENTLSPSSAIKLKDEILKNSLQRKDGSKAPESSKGLVVFILKTK